jgi:tetratricopeptide (TPR) repeat protein
LAKGRDRGKSGPREDSTVAARREILRALNARNSRQYDEALAHYERAVGIDPSLSEAYSGRGGIHALRGNHLEAFEDYVRALDLDSRNADAFGGRGRAKYKLGAPAWALDDLLEAIALDPDEPLSHFHLALVWERLAEIKPARAKTFLANAVQAYDSALAAKGGSEGFRADVSEILASTRKKLATLE